MKILTFTLVVILLSVSSVFADGDTFVTQDRQAKEDLVRILNRPNTCAESFDLDKLERDIALDRPRTDKEWYKTVIRMLIWQIRYDRVKDLY